MSLLAVRDLRVGFETHAGAVEAVRGVDLDVERGETLAIVGESGCGKSATVQAIMGLVPTPPGRVAGSARFDGAELVGLPWRAANRFRGRRIGMVFQDPMTSLNPTLRVGQQVAETLRVHQGLSRAAARRQAVALLERVQIPDAAARAGEYPHRFSGGMRQRVMIAMAIACGPELLIADEPTTALDVTIQAEILALLADLQRERGMAMVLITHDLGVVARTADRVAVMYAGRVVERGGAEEVFARPAHPYTLGLRASLPQGGEGARARLVPIEGSPPDLLAPPPGCAFAARCPHALRVCGREDPPAFPVEGSHGSACWLHHPLAAGRRPPGLHVAAPQEAAP